MHESRRSSTILAPSRGSQATAADPSLAWHSCFGTTTPHSFSSRVNASLFSTRRGAVLISSTSWTSLISELCRLYKECAPRAYQRTRDGVGKSRSVLKVSCRWLTVRVVLTEKLGDFHIGLILISLSLCIILILDLLDLSFSGRTSNSPTGSFKGICLSWSVFTSRIPEVCDLIGHSAVYSVNLALHAIPCCSTDCIFI